jgi:hypothetical protein
VHRWEPGHRCGDDGGHAQARSEAAQVPSQHSTWAEVHTVRAITAHALPSRAHWPEAHGNGSAGGHGHPAESDAQL